MRILEGILPMASFIVLMGVVSILKVVFIFNNLNLR
ncbi:MAG: hypothetical protein K0R31_997 [Clostridiales bacterium]|nr:hypothetical protein [Clostridiales bacterium]